MNALHVGALVALLLAVWAIDRQGQTIGAQGDQITALQGAAGQQADLIARQSRALESQGALASEVMAIGRTTKQTLQTISGQGEQLAASLEELKRNDQESRDYLAMPVPRAVGLRWERAESTDPATYRAAAAGLRSGAVPPARAAAGDPQ